MGANWAVSNIWDQLAPKHSQRIVQWIVPEKGGDHGAPVRQLDGAVAVAQWRIAPWLTR